jgi:hypothetical protein
VPAEMAHGTDCPLAARDIRGLAAQPLLIPT